MAIEEQSYCSDALYIRGVSLQRKSVLRRRCSRRRDGSKRRARSTPESVQADLGASRTGAPYWFTTSSTNKASFFLSTLIGLFVYLAQITTYKSQSSKLNKSMR